MLVDRALPPGTGCRYQPRGVEPLPQQSAPSRGVEPLPSADRRTSLPRTDSSRSTKAPSECEICELVESASHLGPAAVSAERNRTSPQQPVPSRGLEPLTRRLRGARSTWNRQRAADEESNLSRLRGNRHPNLGPTAVGAVERIRTSHKRQ